MQTEAPSTARPAMRPLTPLEARVLAVLLEKQHTVPDTYPLSLNALTAGCNQKTARAPVMNVSETEVLQAIEGLKQLSLAMEGSSSRVTRFEHNMGRVLGIPSQSAAILAVLMLRGPQTAAELRLNTARLHGFADTSSVEAFLDELADGEPARVVKLPRMPGEREHRWTHLLCGEVAIDAMAAADAVGRGANDDALAGTAGGVPMAEFAALRAEHEALSDKVERLQALIERMAGELGIAVDTTQL
ncbi:hypothetical protein BKK79_03525 [Cupriavidus sp. USMAA2-4]|uniref:Uncharacterized protein n=1 Tax=Cupriavidus malaysiensis TaxID=367825 RepID=A0ABM6F3P9_9BURK|nr:MULTISPECIES: YceH family protein [Cupriavidus]AOY90985.1 hypothetical protein BKK79_03525 [Cupriavidus sp. USMAA2-4]AOZ06059.1 hypothetical protein BKK80_09595 [Cupriavidus malaysiensis]